jgi:large subunit ribosomal protein L25
MSTLNVEARESVGKTANKRLRETGRIPAVLYGAKAENVNLSVSVKELLPLLEKRQFEVEVAGAATAKANIAEVQWDALGDYLVHVDLVRV